MSKKRIIFAAVVQVVGLCLCVTILAAITAPNKKTEVAGAKVIGTPNSTGTPRAVFTREEVAANHIFSPVFFRGSFQTIVHLQNRGLATANYVFEFYDGTGTRIDSATVSGTINPKATQVLQSDSMTTISLGATYSFVVSSDQPLESVAQVRQQGTSGDKLAAYHGASGNPGSTTEYFGPFYAQNNGLSSSIWIMNSGGSNANVNLSFMGTNGSALGFSSLTLAPNAAKIVSDVSLGLPPNLPFFWVKANSDQPITGLVSITSANGEVFELQGPLGQGSPQSFLPRALKEVDEGGGARSTSVIVANTGASPGNASLDFHGPDGTVSLTIPLTIPPMGAVAVDLAALGSLPNGVWSVVLVANQPIVIGELTTYRESTYYSTAKFGTNVDSTLSLPGLQRSSSYSLLSLQNAGSDAASLSINYLDLAGNSVLSEQTIIPNDGSARYDLRSKGSLGSSFEGSAFLVSNQPLIASVDNYVVGAPIPPSMVTVSSPITGVVQSSYTFTATASPMSASVPITYVWQATEQNSITHATVSNLVDSISLAWSSPGPKSITVTAMNAGGTKTSIGSDTITLMPAEKTLKVYMPLVREK